MKKILTQDYLKELLHYNELTGIFTWLERPASMFVPGEYQDRSCKTWNSRFANQEAGYIWTQKKGKTSYINVGITLNVEKKLYLAHRLAILYTDGRFPLEDVDHIDGDGLNNKRSNLREVGSLENNKNMPMQSNNTSGCTGVYWNKQVKKWKVSIDVKGESLFGGYFINIEDAIAKRKALEIEHGYHINHGRE